MAGSEHSRTSTVYAAVSEDAREVLVREAKRRDHSLGRLIFIILRNATNNFTDFSIIDEWLGRPSFYDKTREILRERERGG